MNEKIIVINGEPWIGSVTGIERVAFDTVQGLDNIVPPGLIELFLPKNANFIPSYKNIKVVQSEEEIHSLPKWRQFVFQSYVQKRKAIPLDFSNTCPFWNPGIEYIHDIYCALHPEDFTSKRDKLFRLYSCLMYWRIAKKAKKIVTVSEYTKETIVKRYKINPDRVAVVYSTLGQYKDIKADHSVFERIPQIKGKDFYFTLGSLSTRKNLKWIVRHASLFPNEIFLISGKALLNVIPPELQELKNLSNVIMPGYLSDAEVKAIYSKCKAFVFPSYFEGFGMPPLEALSCGAKIIISNRTSLPEIYGKTAHYIDPDEPNVNLEELLKEELLPPDELLEKYSGQKAAERLYKVIEELI